MITAASVHAQVVDIRKPTSALPNQVVTDANILYWVFYPNFPGLQYAGGRQPQPYQVTQYPRFWKRMTQAGKAFMVTPAGLGEFARVAEYAELETAWLTDPNPPQLNPTIPQTQFSPQLCKLARYHYSGQLASVRTTVAQLLASVEKAVQILAQFATATEQHKHVLREWLASAGDFVDAIMVASAKHNGVPQILSDDMDLATFPGITLYTANQRTIDAAQKAAKLV